MIVRLKASAIVLMTASLFSFLALLTSGILFSKPVLILVFVHQALAVNFLLRRAKGKDAIFYNISVRSDLSKDEQDERDAWAAALGILSSVLMVVFPIVLIFGSD